MRVEAEARLLANEDYIALKAFDQALAVLRDHGHGPAMSIGGFVTKAPFTHEGPQEPMNGSLLVRSGFARFRSSHAGPRARPSHADAAERVLKEYGQPVSTSDLLEFMKMADVQVGGSAPLVNLSSTLSKDRRFISIRFNGQSCWALSEWQQDSKGATIEKGPKDNSIALFEVDGNDQQGSS
jgi:hypothetical protein